MKRVVSIIMSVLLLFSVFAFAVNAEEQYVGITSGRYIVNVLPEYYANSTGTVNMIRNPYYQKYYNELLAYSYQLYT